MIFTDSPKAVTLLEVLSLAKNAEISQDLESEAEILKEIWEDFYQCPDLSEYSDEIKAEIFRVCGFFLSNYGRSKAIKGFQERGKDFLTNAVNLFEKYSLFEKSAEAQSCLGICYYRLGDLENAEIYLSDACQFFQDDPLHPVSQKIKVNLISVYFDSGKEREALNLINELKHTISYSKDAHLLAMFHNHAAIVYRRMNFSDSTVIFHYEQSIKFAGRVRNLRFQSSVLNNLAFFYTTKNNYIRALELSCKSIEIATELGDKEWIGNFLDTKADICLAQKKFAEALEAVNQSLEILSQIGAAAAFANSCWTKIKILIAQDNIADALLTFVELSNKTSASIGEKRVNDYAEQFKKLIYIRGTDGFVAESDKFRRSMIESALQTGVEDAADYLKLEKDYFENILVCEFPDIAKREGIVKHVFGVKDIEPITTDARLFIDGKEVFSEAYLFIVPKNKSNFGRTVVVCVLSNVRTGLQILQYDDEFFISNLHFDEFSGYYSIDDFPVPLSGNDIFIVGGVRGICELSDVNMDFINFTPV